MDDSRRTREKRRDLRNLYGSVKSVLGDEVEVADMRDVSDGSNSLQGVLAQSF